jgi:hypothetical protein
MEYIKVITQEVLDLHAKWLRGEDGGKKLISAVGPIEIRADLSGADLSGADLRGADLRGADLSRANLSGADLSRANLSGADLSRADLSRANLSEADLSGADLSGADLSRADLSEAKNAEYAEALVSILPAGTLIGWKQLERGLICKLEIPADARRSNASGRKCRAEYAKVLAIYDGEKEVETGVSKWDEKFMYCVGEIVRANAWDECRWNECSSGVHFFITRIEAEKY